MEVDENMNSDFKLFDAAPAVRQIFLHIGLTPITVCMLLCQNERGIPAKKPAPDYFL